QTRCGRSAAIAERAVEIAAAALLGRFQHVAERRENLRPQRLGNDVHRSSWVSGRVVPSGDVAQLSTAPARGGAGSASPVQAPLSGTAARACRMRKLPARPSTGGLP